MECRKGKTNKINSSKWELLKSKKQKLAEFILGVNIFPANEESTEEK